MALKLRKYGIRNVRPLLGGFHEWKRLGLPLIDIPEEASTESAAGTGLAAEHSA